MSVEVSIVIPTYNAQRWVEGCIRSIAAQTYPHDSLELIIVDDGSRDDTVRLAEAALATTTLKGRIIRCGRNGGAGAARNLGWKSATGKWIQFLDVDDLIAPNKIELQAKVAAECPGDIAVIISKWQMLEPHGGDWRDSDLIEVPAFGADPVLDLMGNKTVGYLGPKLIRRSILETISGFDEQMVSAEDLDLTMRIAVAGGKFCEAPSAQPLYFYRLSVPNSRSRSCPPRRGAEMIFCIGAKAEQHLKRKYAGRIPREGLDGYRSFYSWALTVLFEEDRERFNHALASVRALDPDFRPGSAKKKFFARIAGYENAERLGLLYRRAKKQAGSVLARAFAPPTARLSFVGLSDWSGAQACSESGNRRPNAFGWGASTGLAFLRVPPLPPISARFPSPGRAALVACLVVLALAEGTLRLAGYHPRLIDSGLFVANGDPLLPYKLRPGYDGYYDGGHVTVAQSGHRLVPSGARGSSFQATAAGSGGLLLLGDAVVFGQGLDDGDTIAARLQGLLPSADGMSQVETIAAPGYTAWNEYAGLRDYQRKSNVRTVILVYVPNNLRFDNDDMKIGAGNTGPGDNSLAHRVTLAMYRTLYLTYLVADNLKWIVRGHSHDPRPAAWEELDPKAISYSLEAVERIKGICEAQGATFIVALFRDIEDYHLKHEAMDQYERAMLHELSEHGIAHFVLSDHTDRLSFRGATLAWNDPHPSSEAADLMARQIYQELLRRALLE